MKLPFRIPTRESESLTYVLGCSALWLLTSVIVLCSVAVFAEAYMMPLLIQWNACWETSLSVLRFEMIPKNDFWGSGD